MPFGFGGKKEPKVEKPEYKFEVKYLGGHKAFPAKKSMDTHMLVYSDRIDLDKPLNLNIPYSSITKFENMDDKKISALRVVGLGLVFLPLAIVGAMWKKKKVYTVIEYNDGLDSQTMVFDFEKYLEKMQPIIYHKVMQQRSKDKL
jgi:hypothetical protein